MSEDYPILSALLLYFVLFCIFALILYIPESMHEKSITGIYEYTDANNNKGYAVKCVDDDGQLVCYTKDNNAIKVLEYEKIG